MYLKEKEKKKTMPSSRWGTYDSKPPKEPHRVVMGGGHPSAECVLFQDSLHKKTIFLKSVAGTWPSSEDSSFLYCTAWEGNGNGSVTWVPSIHVRVRSQVSSFQPQPPPSR